MARPALAASILLGLALVSLAPSNAGARGESERREAITVTRSPETHSSPSNHRLRNPLVARLGYDPVVVSNDVALRLADLETRPPGEHAHESPRLAASSLQAAETDDSSSNPPLFQFDGLVGGSLTLGSMPHPAGAFSLGVGLGWGRWMFHLEGRTDWTGRFETEAGTFDTSLLLAEVAGCRRFGFLFGCGVVAAGALRFSRSAPEASTRTSQPYVALGARLGADFRMYGPLSIRARGELLSPVVRTRASVGSRSVWRPPPLSGRMGVALVVSFF
jgi:hypothetical protein